MSCKLRSHAHAFAVCLILTIGCAPSDFDRLAAPGASACSSATSAATTNVCGTPDSGEQVPGDLSTQADGGSFPGQEEAGRGAAADVLDSSLSDARSDALVAPSSDAAPGNMAGADGGGCETDVAENIDHCGACRQRCVAPEDGFASCSGQVCSGHTLRLGRAAVGPLRGSSATAPAFSNLCREGEVVTGISGVGDDVFVNGLAARCARLTMTNTAARISVTTVRSWTTAMAGGTHPERTKPFALECPPGAIVTGFGGSTWQYDAANPNPIYRQMSIICSSIEVSPSLQVSLTPVRSLEAGTRAPMPVASFVDPCGLHEAVAGFSGRFGVDVIAVATHCGPLVIQTAPAAP